MSDLDNDRGGPGQEAAQGESWTAGDPPTRETIQPGTNSPAIKGIGWRRAMSRLLQAKGIR